MKIASALNLRLSASEERAVEHRYTQNPQAYDAFLRGQALLGFPDLREKLEGARKTFETALQSDPNYPLALAGLSKVEANYYRNLDSGDTSHLQRAQQLAEQVLAIDPQLAEAHVALGYFYADKYEYGLAVAEFQKATSLEPGDGSAWDLLSWALGYQIPPDALEAEKAAREAVRLGNGSASTYYHLGRALNLQGRFPEAITAFERVRQISPTSPTSDLGLAQDYLAQGDSTRAVQILANQNSKAAINRFWASAAYAAHGDTEKALDMLKKSFATRIRGLRWTRSMSLLLAPALRRSLPAARSFISKMICRIGNGLWPISTAMQSRSLVRGLLKGLQIRSHVVVDGVAQFLFTAKVPFCCLN